MSIEKLTFSETYYININSSYKRDVVERCLDVFGRLPIDCFGTTITTRRESSKKVRITRNKEKLADAEWI